MLKCDAASVDKLQDEKCRDDGIALHLFNDSLNKIYHLGEQYNDVFQRNLYLILERRAISD